ncbi:MAG: helix-turn-helix transcriptional regulator [Clostridia bacterium]|nr:helix-turn-helix transcriptional regulator [Clostridia bacterium]
MLEGISLDKRIKQLREANGMTQVDLANELFVSKQSVSNWENDNILPSIEVLIRIADRFGVTTDYLLGRDDIPRLSVNGLPLKVVEHINDIITDIREASVSTESDTVKSKKVKKKQQ